jgi:predicted phosphodiesterase
MIIAIFSDVHGRAQLCFKLCARWQQETGEQIDLILQAGDLGAFFSEASLDKATRRYAQSDPSELGFLHNFVQYDPLIEKDLAKVSCNLVFVRGNHEDHAWLDQLEQKVEGPTFPVDVYKRIYCLRTGMPYVFQRGDEQLCILGVGRIGARDGVEDLQQAKYIQRYESERIVELGNVSVDVLLTHDAPRKYVYPESGLEEIGLILEQYKPSYHFFGHYGGPHKQSIYPQSGTQMHKLADLHWGKNISSTLEEGSMGILRWQNNNENSFEVVNATWMKEYTWHRWRHL